MKFLSRAFFAVTFFITTLLTTSTYAQSLGIHYGPRTFFPAPIGTNAINIQYEHLNAGIYNLGPIESFNLETNSVMISYTHYFDFFGKTASVVASIPYVKLKGNLKLPGGDIPIFEEQGITDPYFQFYTPLIGGDALDIQSFVRKEPGFIAGIYVAMRPPLGEYDESKSVNPGSNRWEWRMGFPIQYIVGLPTNQTSFEFVPTVYFFGDNDEVSGGGTSGQEPLFQFEAHLTHDLNQMFWGSLNVMYAFGGEGTGKDTGGEFDILGGGATFGARLPHSFGVTVTLGTSLRTKTGNEDGNWVRASITKNF